ncbi:hypothetical protein BC834DRAFT_971090 [Gloeopeniophorella convolvens]|nr:hypothetical protein BC834DRAFT_971090 [Gloeopeniophorella convolvens]
MAPSIPDSQATLRPAMRRKSSAQNLLSSFKPGSSSTPPPQPAPASASASPPAPSAPSSALPTPSTSGTSTPILSPPLPHLSMHHAQAAAAAAAYASLATPTTATPPARDWDAQSLHADAVAPPAGIPGATVEYLRDLVQKRIITLTYMRNVHDGRSHWFHTIMMSRAELDRVFNNAAMRKRTHRFAVLAMSLSALFDISQPTDLMRSALNMLIEYEQSKEDGDRPKMRLWRRPQKRHPGVSDYALNVTDAASDTFLTIPHMPFPLDYTQTLLSLLDILSALYAKLAKLLGPSPFPHASQHMLGLAPHPGVSYLFQHHTPASAADDALWNVALGTGGGAAPPAGALGSPPPSWTPALGELVLKVDGKFKKIIAVLLKDLDAFARNSIKDELASLDPLLRNVGGWGGVPGAGAGEDAGGRAVYDFDQ